MGTPTVALCKVYQLKVYQAEAGLSPHNLTQDIVIRWSSMHDMLDDLRVNREPIMVYDIRAKESRCFIRRQ